LLSLSSSFIPFPGTKVPYCLNADTWPTYPDVESIKIPLSKLNIVKGDQVSISSTSYEQLFSHESIIISFSLFTCWVLYFWRKEICVKTACKMLMKLIPTVAAAFISISSLQFFLKILDLEIQVMNSEFLEFHSTFEDQVK